MSGDSTDKGSTYSDIIDRRRFLELTGASGAAALAGCNTGDDNSTDSTDSAEPGSSNTSQTDESSEGAQVHDATLTDFNNQIVPTNIQFNSFNPTNYTAIPPLYDPYVQYNYARGEFIPYAIQDWSMGDSSFEMSIREDLTWENGDPVTGEDIAVQMRLLRDIGSPLWDYTESVEATGEKTVKLNFSETPNPRIAEFQILLGNSVSVKASEYKEFVGDSEALAQYEDTDATASGPWKVESTSQEKMTMVRREDHPDSENINFSNFEQLYISNNQQIYQAMISGELDSGANLFTPPRITEQFPDHVVEALIPNKWGVGLVPNHDRPHVGKRKVRQAIAYAINRDQVVQNAGRRTKQAPGVMTPIPADDQERWLGDQMDSYRTYGKGSSDTEKVDQLMQEAGYSKNDGTWTDGDGNTVSIPILVPSGWSDWVSAIQTVADQLTSAGFDASVDAREYSSLGGQAWTNGDFSLSAFYWLPGGASASFPYFGLEHQLVHSAETVKYNYPDEVTVPQRNGSGEFTTTPADRLSTLATSTEEKTTSEIILEQAWVANVDLPMIPIAEKLIQSFVTSDEWNVPEAGSEKYQVNGPPYWLPRQGDLTYNPS